LFEAELGDNGFTTGKELNFDLKDKYVCISSREKVMIYSTDKDSMGELVKDYSMDQEKYEVICDVKLNSAFDKKAFYKKINNGVYQTNVEESEIDAPYTCMIACKPQGITAIHFFDINNE
jgi:hypothetical protein